VNRIIKEHELKINMNKKMTVKQWLNKCTYLDSNINSEGGKKPMKEINTRIQKIYQFYLIKKGISGGKKPKAK
jgi:hypothetical protein